jgi:RNA-directed DNA polymerase
MYAKAKAEPTWRFWGLYVHVCKMETLRTAYEEAKKNKGAPGIDGETFEVIEAQGVAEFILQIQRELTARTYRPARGRVVEIPKDGGKKTRRLSIPTIRDRVVQGALKLVLEPIFEANFQPGSFGYRPQKSAVEAVERVSDGIARNKTMVIDLDLRAYFDNVRQDILLEKVAERIDDQEVMHLLKMILKAAGRRGVPQGGVISPLLSNIYLNEVDNMLQRAKEVTRRDGWDALEYARFADDLVVAVDPHWRNRDLWRKVEKRLREEFAKLKVEVNEDKSRVVDLQAGGSFCFLGFEIRRIRTRVGRWMPLRMPALKKRMALLRQLKECFAGLQSQPVTRVIEKINPILRGWVNYFAHGHSSRCFGYIRDWVEKKIRRHLMKARKCRRGFGWKRWSRKWLYEELGLFCDYRIKYTTTKVEPA